MRTQFLLIGTFLVLVPRPGFAAGIPSCSGLSVSQLNAGGRRQCHGMCDSE
jgi:hypothetical protein